MDALSSYLCLTRSGTHSSFLLEAIFFPLPSVSFPFPLCMQVFLSHPNLSESLSLEHELIPSSSLISSTSLWNRIHFYESDSHRCCHHLFVIPVGLITATSNLLWLKAELQRVPQSLCPYPTMPLGLLHSFKSPIQQSFWFLSFLPLPHLIHHKIVSSKFFSNLPILSNQQSASCIN